MMITLFNGSCSLRYKCRNVNKKICEPLPKKGALCIECLYYKPREEFIKPKKRKNGISLGSFY